MSFFIQKMTYYIIIRMNTQFQHPFFIKIRQKKNFKIILLNTSLSFSHSSANFDIKAK